MCPLYPEGQAGDRMGEQPSPLNATGASRLVNEILVVLAAQEPRGATADQIVRTLGRDHDPAQVQDALEELVEWGVVDRRGIGVGAVYTLKDPV